MPTGRFPRIHPAGDGSLGDIKAQHEQFAMNARRAPGWVLRHHTQDQLSELPSTVFSYRPIFSPSRSNSSTVETSAMPANDCLRIDEHQRLLPSTPKTTGECPEDFVNRYHPGSGRLALQHGQLLPESEIFQEQASMRLKAAGEQAQP